MKSDNTVKSVNMSMRGIFSGRAVNHLLVNVYLSHIFWLAVIIHDKDFNGTID